MIYYCLWSTSWWELYVACLLMAIKIVDEVCGVSWSTTYNNDAGCLIHTHFTVCLLWGRDEGRTAYNNDEENPSLWERKYQINCEYGYKKAAPFIWCIFYFWHVYDFGKRSISDEKYSFGDCFFFFPMIRSKDLAWKW